MAGILTRHGKQVRLIPSDIPWNGLREVPVVEEKPAQGKHLPTDPKQRKRIPLYSGLLKYFPDALVAIAELSQVGNEQHNPGQPLHWAREKSTDQEDTLMRHLLESGTVDVDGIRHSTKVAWRALAMLQLELEQSRKDESGDNQASSETALSGYRQSRTIGSAAS